MSAAAVGPIVLDAIGELLRLFRDADEPELAARCAERAEALARTLRALDARQAERERALREG